MRELQAQASESGECSVPSMNFVNQALGAPTRGREHLQGRGPPALSSKRSRAEIEAEYEQKNQELHKEITELKANMVSKEDVQAQMDELRASLLSQFQQMLPPGTCGTNLPPRPPHPPPPPPAPQAPQARS
jgi:hypothetical protein